LYIKASYLTHRVHHMRTHRQTDNIIHSRSLLYFLRLTAIFPVKLGLVGFIGAKNDWGGGDNWSYKTCKAPVKMSPPTNQHLTPLN